jgi:hypothetical protein
MRKKPFVPDRAGRRRVTVVLLCILLIVSLAPVTQAQSGRRPPMQPKSPDPLPPKQDEPPIKQPSDKPSNSQIPVKVVWNLPNIGSPTVYTQIVEDGCVERLSQSDLVKPTRGAELNRKQASDIAKASADTYVLWFELDVDAIDGGRYPVGSVPPQYLYVNYVVFTPGTGKSRTSGHVYQRQRGPAGMPLPLPGPQTGSSADYSLRYAGREMADRLLDALSLSHPPDRH